MYILYFLHLQKMCETVTIYESIILVQPYIISVQWKAFSISDIIYVGPINAVWQQHLATTTQTRVPPQAIN